MGHEITYSLTPERKDAFKKLKSRILNDYGPDAAEDDQIYRFLKAKDYDLKQAEIMLRNHLEWRKKSKTDSILETFKMGEIQKKYVQMNIIGFDNEGCPVVFFDFGNMDMKGIPKAIKKSELLRYLVYFLTTCEKALEQQTEKLKRPVKKWSCVMDFENLSLSQALSKPAIDILLESFSIYESNYPERLKTAYAINVNVIFNLIYNIIRPILSPTTLNKIRIFGKDGWKEELLKFMNPEELPAFLGGKRTDPDGNPLCQETVNHGGIVPKSLYLTNNEQQLTGQAGVKKYYLSRKGKINITVDIAEPGSKIEWDLETENNDIAFGLFYRENDNSEQKLKPVVDIQRVDTHMEVETGLFLCEEAGTYIMTLDNSYSWLRQKQILCRIAVIKPNGQKYIVTS